MIDAIKSLIVEGDMKHFERRDSGSKRIKYFMDEETGDMVFCWWQLAYEGSDFITSG